MLDLHALEAFVVVAEVLNLREAAGRLSCSTSAVSRRLDRAERQTGLQLLSRSPRRTLLTEQGSVYLPVARALLAEEQRAREAAERLRRPAESVRLLDDPRSVATDATLVAQVGSGTQTTGSGVPSGSTV